MEKSSETGIRAVIQNLRRVREFKGYSQEYVAFKLAVSQNAYSKIELGHSNLSLEKYYMICAALEVDPADLIKAELPELSATETEN